MAAIDVEFSEIDSKYVNKLISTTSIVYSLNNPKPRFNTALFECKGCLRIIEVDQCLTENLIEPTLCSDCGGRSFRILDDKSSYVDVQKLVLGNESTNKKLPVFLVGEDCCYDDYNVMDIVRVTGILKVNIYKNNFDYYLEVESIDKIDVIEDDFNDESSEDDSVDRNTSEYTQWHKEIINKDKVCQCCGGHKYLQVHHIYGVAKYPDLITNNDNGIVLCKWCHGKYHSYYGKHATPRSLIKFLNRFGSVRL